MERIKVLLRLFRVHQWSKNVFVIAPVLFAGKIQEPQSLKGALATFAIFCLISSAVYIINDILDIEEDKKHPVKRKRPIASGEVPIPIAYIIITFLVAISIVSSYKISRVLSVIVMLYFLLNIGYSLFLKRIAILDVLIVATGFLLRVEAGAVAIEVSISPWLFTTTFYLALLLVLAKRRSDLAWKNKTEMVTYEITDIFIAISASAVLISYSLYCIFSDLGAKYEKFVYTSIFVIFGVFRFLQLTYKNLGTPESPTEFMLYDAPFILNGFLWVVTVSIIIYIL